MSSDSGQGKQSAAVALAFPSGLQTAPGHLRDAGDRSEARLLLVGQMGVLTTVGHQVALPDEGWTVYSPATAWGRALLSYLTGQVSDALSTFERMGIGDDVTSEEVQAMVGAPGNDRLLDVMMALNHVGYALAHDVRARALQVGQTALTLTRMSGHLGFEPYRSA